MPAMRLFRRRPFGQELPHRLKAGAGGCGAERVGGVSLVAHPRAGPCADRASRDAITTGSKSGGSCQSASHALHLPNRSSIQSSSRSAASIESSRPPSISTTSDVPYMNTCATGVVYAATSLIASTDDGACADSGVPWLRTPEPASP